MPDDSLALDVDLLTQSLERESAVGLEENRYFFEVSRLNRGITKLDERIAAAQWREPLHVENDDKFGELDTVSGSLDLMKLTRILSEGHVSLASMKAFRETLVEKLRDVYQQFADQEFQSLSELREDSVLGGPAEQCAFAVTAVLDSFANQFEEHVDRKNCTVELLLEFSDQLSLPDQSKGDPEPLSGSGMVRLSDGIGAPCNGMRVGNDEIRIVDDAQTVTEFINEIAEVASDLICAASSSERSHALEHDTFSVSEEREYSYGEAVFPNKVGDVKR